MAFIIFAGLGLLCSALCLTAANEDAITRISKTNVFIIPPVILCFWHLNVWLAVSALWFHPILKRARARRFLCFGVCIYGWQSCLSGSIL